MDIKNVTPSIDFSLIGKVWDIKVNLKDLMAFTNEFNTPRHDTIDTGVDFDLTPDYFPPLKTSYRINEDYQRGLLDTIDRKLDLSTSYSFDYGLTLDGSWRTGEKNDLLRSDSDTSTFTWDANLNYSAVLTPALKLSYLTGLKGGLDETFDHDTGVIVSSTPTHLITNKLKLSFDGFPAGTTSLLELSRENDIALQDVKDVVGVEVDLQQEVLALATIKELLRYDFNGETSPTVQDAEDKVTFTLDITGSPYRYLDYSLKYNFVESWKDSLAPATTGTIRTGTFDASFTLNPTPPFLLDVAYSRELKDDKGVASQTRTFKVKGTFKGEFLDVPNLTFNPTINMTRDYNRAAGSFTRNNDVRLEFKYAFVLPRPFILELGPSYVWTYVDGERTAQDVLVTYKFQTKFTYATWVLDLLAQGDFQNLGGPTDGGGRLTTGKEAGIEISKDLTMTMGGRFKYRYKVPSEASAGNSDSTELGVTWDYLTMGVELLATRDRTFLTPRVETRKYSARFSWQF